MRSVAHAVAFGGTSLTRCEATTSIASVNRKAPCLLAFAFPVGALVVAATVGCSSPPHRDMKRRPARQDEIAKILLAPNPVWRAGMLVDYAEEPEAAVALVDCAALLCSSSNAAFLARDDWRLGIEIWALEREPSDPRPLEHIEELLRDTALPEPARLELLYLKREIREPRYRAALDLPDEPEIDGDGVTELFDALCRVAPIEIQDDRPRCFIGNPCYPHVAQCRPPVALARVAHMLDLDIVRVGEHLVLRPRS